MWSKRTQSRLRIAGLAIGALALIAGGGWIVDEIKNGGDAFPKVPPGHVAILLRNSGRLAPRGAIIAPAPNGGEPYQGVQEDVLPPGWYPTGYDPYQWDC